MGFLGSIGGFIGGAVKAVTKTITSPARLTSAIVTGGASVVAPKTFAPLTSAISSTLYNPALLGKAASVALPGVAGRAASLLPSTGGSMAFNLGNLIPGVVSGLGSFLGGASPSTALSNFTSFLPGYGNTQAFPTNPYSANTMAAVPGAARAVATVGRSFFNKYPNLATAIQSYRNMGKNVTRAKLYSLLKRFGPDLLISGGILTAAAISELMVAGPGRRRMNPGNVKALRRSLRRLESFHHLCQRADKLRRPRCSSRTSRGRSQQFVRQG